MPKVNQIPASSGQRFQRADGGVSLTVRRDGAATRLVDLRQASPCRALFPRIGPGEPLQVVLVNTGGGWVEGDRLLIEIEARAGARLAVTTQAAEKAYRSISATCSQAVQLRIGRGAMVDWEPRETILFDGSRLRRGFGAALDRDARLLAVETVLFGRAARGETLTRGFLHDSWAIRRSDRLVWADAMCLDGDIAQLMRRPFGFGEAAGYSTVLYVGEDAASFLPVAREAAERGPWRGGASLVNGLLLTRLLDTNEARLRLAAQTVGAALRAALARDTGLP